MKIGDAGEAFFVVETEVGFDFRKLTRSLQIVKFPSHPLI